MSFIDLLRASRSKPVTALHKFLTNYDPNNARRIYAFVEGGPDQAFYRAHISLYAKDASDVFMYKCDGKEHVYKTYLKVIERYAACTRILFFVDKDVDDILGTPWPVDPRIFVTEYYSIENYLNCDRVLAQFLTDYVKIRRVDVDLTPIIEQFKEQLNRFHRLVLPIMSWIVVMRRAGNRVMLRDVDMDKLFQITDSVTVRRPRREALTYLLDVTHISKRNRIWRDVRKTCRELGRLEAKRYVRGKFEAWWFIKFTQVVIDSLVRIVGEHGGSTSIQTHLSVNNYIQLLARTISTPNSLKSFLDFHLADHETVSPTRLAEPESWIKRILKGYR